MSPEWKESLRMAQRSSANLDRAFALFTMLIAGHQSNPKEALESVQSSMAIWSDYEDQNRVEFPDFSPPVPPVPAQPANAIVVYAIVAAVPGFGIQIHTFKGKLSVYERQDDAQNETDRMNARDPNRPWRVFEVGGSLLSPVEQKSKSEHTTKT